MTRYIKHTRETIVNPHFIDAGLGTTVFRPELFDVLYSQVVELGIRAHFGVGVQDYYEMAGAGKARIIFTTGAKAEADIILAADGVGSHS
jgi:2-polyprenyl-6-methoxyphenol hydroxylase-like FAD-dependent oxidoreductase